MIDPTLKIFDGREPLRLVIKMELDSSLEAQILNSQWESAVQHYYPRSRVEVNWAAIVYVRLILKADHLVIKNGSATMVG